jgi:hypothetical protein
MFIFKVFQHFLLGWRLWFMQQGIDGLASNLTNFAGSTIFVKKSDSFEPRTLSKVSPLFQQQIFFFLSVISVDN